MVTVNTLILAVTVMLTWSEAVVLNKCDLTSRLKEAFLVFDRVEHQDILAQFVCTVEQTSRFNTSVISINEFKPEPMTPTTTIYGQGEKEQFVMKKKLVEELVEELAEELILEEQFISEERLLTEIVTEDYLTPGTRLRVDAAGNEDPLFALKVILEDDYGDYLGEEPSEESGRDFIYWSEEGFTNHSEKGSGEEFFGNGSGNYSGEGSGEEIFGSGSGNYSGEGSGEEIFGSGSGNYSGEGSGEEIFGSGSGNYSGEGSGEEIFGSGSGNYSGEGSGEEIFGSGSGNYSGEGSGEEISGSGSGNYSGEGSGEEISGSGSGNYSGEGSGDDFSGSKEASGIQYEIIKIAKREVLIDMFGDDYMEGSGNEYSEGSGDDFSGSGSREASGVLYEGIERLKREVPRANFGDGFTEGSRNEFIEGSGIYPENQHEKRAFHKVEDLRNLKTITPDDEQKDSSEEQHDDSISQKLFGIFQLGDYFACNSGSNHNLNLCQMDCTALTDDDVTDDIACLKILNVFGISTMISAQCETVTSADYLAECH